MDFDTKIKNHKQLNQLVVKDNSLIQEVRFNLTATQQKFIAYIVSQIKPSDYDLPEFEIKVSDFCFICGIDKTWFYSEFKKMVDGFDNNNCFWIESGNELYKFRWFADTRYLKGKGTIKITLAKTLKDYLIGLTKSFTQYELYNIIALKSKYAIKLFELFKSYEYQKTKRFEVEQLKELLFATNYTNFFDFNKRCLSPAIKEINEYTELNVKYDVIKQGRKVISVKFIIDKKKMVEAYISYKKTIDKIDRDNKTIPGQISFFD